MKRILSLIALCWMVLPAFGQTTYQPASEVSFSGANTYCVGASMTPLTFKYTTCTSGTGAASGAPYTITWYYNTTNSTSTATATIISGPTSGTTPIADTVTESYTPVFSTGGNYYVFCVIDWSSGTPSCGGVTGSLASSSTQLVTVGPAPIAPASPINICVGYNTTLTNSFAGGTWVSSNPSVVEIDTFSGVANGHAIGAAVITYTWGGCTTTAFVYSNDNPATISPSGLSTVCQSTTAALSNSTPGGFWTSSNPSVASVGSSTGVVSGFVPGTATISYTIASTGCYNVRPISVLANPDPITGTTDLCETGGTTTLSTTSSGGVWISGNTSVATVPPLSGVVTGGAAGTSRITYQYISSGCQTTTTVHVYPHPAPTITGPDFVCATNTITLANAVAGGSWWSGGTGTATVGTSTGVVTGVAAGSVNISYGTPGCPAVAKSVTVNPLPAAIAGVFSTCYGQTVTLSVPGPDPGFWYGSDTDIAVVDSGGGAVTGVSMGTSVISFRTFAGCVVTQVVTVNPLAPIVGSDSVCVGSHILLTDIVGGGTWVSSNPAIAAVDTFTGIVSGLLTGITYIGYSLPTGCHTTFLLDVIPSLPAIAGPTAVCSNTSVTLSNGVTGGVWHSTNEFVAEVDTLTGALIGHFPDTATVMYSVIGCQTATVITVNPLPSPSISFNPATQKLSTDPIYTSYQWYDSTHGVLPGATSYQLLLPLGRENYYVVVTDGNGCAGMSATYKAAVGVNDVHNPGHAVIYPNPAGAFINIERSQNARVVVAGMEGRAVLQTSKPGAIDVAGLSPGIYMVSVYDGDRLIAVGKFIKQ